MKNSKIFGLRLTTLLISGIVFFSSCVEQPLEYDTRVAAPTADTIEDLKVSEFFEWNTTREVSVIIEGLPVDVGVNRKLALMTASGDEIFAGSHKMHEDFEMSFDLPSVLGAVTMKYGSIEKTTEIIGNSVSFDFFPELIDEVEE